MADVIEINDESFENEVLKSDKITLVDFWATWCGPCQMMGPVVEEISKELDGKVKVAKVNVDENPNLAEQYDVMSIPNFVLFKNGAVVNQAVGAVGKEGLLNLING